jgi:tetratricopeptide (TPR) repeat protein
VRCFAWLYEIRGWFGEGIEQLELVVQASRARAGDEVRQRVLGQALAQQGLLLFRQGQFAQAQTLFGESLAILRPFGDPALLLDPLVFSGTIMFLDGETDRAQAQLKECLACARAADEPWFAAYARYNQGYIASLLGQSEEGYEEMLVGLAEWRALGDARHTALGLNHISPTAVRLGRHEQAKAFLQESLMLCTQVGDRWGMGTAYRHLGLLALAQGHLDEARSLIQRSLDLFAGFITGWDVVRSLLYLGEAVLATGDLPEARRIFLDGLRQAVQVRALPLALDALIGLAYLHARGGEAEQALEMSICVSQHTASTQEVRDRAAHLRAGLKDQLTPRQIAAAWAQPKTFEAVLKETLKAIPAQPGLQPAYTVG